MPKAWKLKQYKIEATLDLDLHSDSVTVRPDLPTNRLKV